MATGIEMMVSALLKSVGFSREQFDATLSTVKTEFDAMKSRAERAETALRHLLESQAIIMKHLGITADSIAAQSDDGRQTVLTLDQPGQGEKGN